MSKTMTTSKKAKRKEKDIQTWLEIAKSEIDKCISIDRAWPKNEMGKSLKHMKSTIEHYNESVKWWKHTVEDKELHEAEKLFKILHSEFVRIEKEKKSS